MHSFVCAVRSRSVQSPFWDMPPAPHGRLSFVFSETVLFNVIREFGKLGAPMAGAVQRRAITTLLLLVAVWLPVGAQERRSQALTTAQATPTPLPSLEQPKQQPSIMRIEPVGPLQLAGDKAPAWTYWVP